MKRSRLPRLLLPALLAAGLLLPVSAQAAAPQHTNFSFSDTGVNVCGISVNITGSGVDTFMPIFGSSGNLIATRDIHEEQDVLTATNGKSLLQHDAGQQINQVTSNTYGGRTFTTTYLGLPAQFLTANGPVISQDAGLITFTAVFDSQGTLISETTTVNGPHPEGTGATSYCQIITAALS